MNLNNIVMNDKGICFIISKESSFKYLKDIFSLLNYYYDKNRINVFLYRDDNIDNNISIVMDIIRILKDIKLDEEDINIFFLGYKPIYLNLATINNLISLKPDGIYIVYVI